MKQLLQGKNIAFDGRRAFLRASQTVVNRGRRTTGANCPAAVYANPNSLTFMFNASHGNMSCGPDYPYSVYRNVDYRFFKQLQAIPTVIKIPNALAIFVRLRPTRRFLATKSICAKLCCAVQNRNPSDPADHSAGRDLSDPNKWVDDYGDYLFNYAVARLRDTTLAEDIVQETFLAAIKGKNQFAGRSAEKSWLTGILKNKIYDHFRKASRETSFTDIGFYADEEEDRFITSGIMAGGWIHDKGPMEWTHAGESLDNEVFWRAYRDCSSKLPKTVAAVFNLREMDDLKTGEICQMLNITENNMWVMLHRARMALRRCLETNWFSKQT